MKWAFILFVIFIVFPLVGCTDDQKDDNTYNSAQPSEETTMEKEAKSVEKETVDQNDDHSTRPPNFSLRPGGIPSKLNAFCWKKINCSLSPRTPEEVLEDISPIAIKTVKPGQTLSFDVTVTSGYGGTLYAPDKIEVTQIHNNNETEIEVSNRQLIAPEKKGIYFLHVYAKWEKEINGEAYYAFKIRVR